MNKPSKEDIMKKWAPILESIEETKSEDLVSSIAMKVSSKLISNEIAGFASKEEIDAVKSRVQSDNRDGKIEAIIEGGEFTENKLEDDEEYKELMKKGVTTMSAPSGTLFYMDYQYGDESQKKKDVNI